MILQLGEFQIAVDPGVVVHIDGKSVTIKPESVQPQAQPQKTELEKWAERMKEIRDESKKHPCLIEEYFKAHPNERVCWIACSCPKCNASYYAGFKAIDLTATCSV